MDNTPNLHALQAAILRRQDSQGVMEYVITFGRRFIYIWTLLGILLDGYV